MVVRPRAGSEAGLREGRRVDMAALRGALQEVVMVGALQEVMVGALQGAMAGALQEVVMVGALREAMVALREAMAVRPVRLLAGDLRGRKAMAPLPLRRPKKGAGSRSSRSSRASCSSAPA
ncbi:MAG TPA: hypothetical protein VE093_08600 [Polyangiaceae bacterium]|nr:hypothetical protein [Polyangiaceae bacterium]